MTSIYLPLDPSGKQSANKVSNEVHTLVTRPIRLVIPDYGAFFEKSLVVKDVTKNVTLASTQYRCAQMLVTETKKYGKRICSGILITDPNVSNKISITYQALGSWSNYSKNALNSALAALGDGQEDVLYEDILNKPDAFPPIPNHLHHASEVYGAEYLQNAFGRVNTAAGVGDNAIQSKVKNYIGGLLVSGVDAADKAVDDALAAHVAILDPHPQYAKPTDLINTTLPVVRKPSLLWPQNNDPAVVLETPFTGSSYYTLYGLPQQAAQFNLSLAADFSDVQYLVVVDGATQTWKPPSLLQGSKKYYARVRYQDSEGVWSDWSNTVSFTTVPPYPPAGTVLNTYCKVGTHEQWQTIADGLNGSYEKLKDAQSTVCGYVPPLPRGTLIETFCKVGTVELWGTFADGNYGTYNELIDAKSTTCGYVPPPVAGTVLRDYCQGYDHYQDIADGKGGYTSVLYEHNSQSFCNYVPPIPYGTVLRRYCELNTTIQHTVIADGNNGEIDTITDYKSIECGYVPPPVAGTILKTYCKEGTYDKYQTIANGDGTSHEQLIERDSTYCGYVPPPTYPPKGEIIGYTCNGTTKYDKIADGNGGFTLGSPQLNSTLCGYQPPAAGTVLNTYCKVGTVDKWRTYADGSGGSYDKLYIAKDPDCGYVAPAILPPSWVSGSGQTVISNASDVVFTISNFTVTNNDGTVNYLKTEWEVYDRSGVKVYTGSSTAASAKPTVPITALKNSSSYTIYARHVSLTIGAGPWSVAANFTTNWPVYPPAGTVLQTYCKVGTHDKWRTYADGSGGSYDQLYIAKDPDCGYVPPEILPPSWVSGDGQVVTDKTVNPIFTLSAFAVTNNDGTVNYLKTEWEVYNSAGTKIYTGSSSTAGAKPTVPVSSLVNNAAYKIYARHVSLSIGASAWSAAANFTTNWVVNPPAGTVLNTYCKQGTYDKYNTVADGNGGTTEVLVEHNSSFCNWVSPFTPTPGIPTDLYAYSGATSGASARLDLKADGTWAVTCTGNSARSPNASGRYLNGTSNGYEIFIDEQISMGVEDIEAGLTSIVPPLGNSGYWASLASGQILMLQDSSADTTGASVYFDVTIRLIADPTVKMQFGISMDVDGFCLVEGTLLHTPQGDRAVEILKTGDTVSSFNEPTMLDATVDGWMDWSIPTLKDVDTSTTAQVANTRRFMAKHSIKLNGLHSTLSHVHFVYDSTTGTFGWKKARDVVVGDAFVTRERDLVPITTIEMIDEPYVFVSVNVEDLDTMQVKLGTQYLLTHNIS